MSLQIRPFAPDEAGAVDAYCAIRLAADPDEAETPEGILSEEATYPGQVRRLLAWLDGEAVGAASVGRLHIYGPDHPQYYFGCWILQRVRDRGVDSGLYRAASEFARASGKTGFRSWVSEARADVVAFLRANGFIEQDRSKAVALDLRPLRAGEDANVLDPVPPDGFTLVPLAAHRDLLPGVHQVAVEAYPSIPTTTPMEPGTLAEFTARDVDRYSIPLDGFFVAVEAATGDVAGYANLIYAAGSTTVAHHDMTAVRPACRGRGLATALKRATIAWAVRAGLDELRANNDEENAPMRAINARLGYRPRPDEIGFAGPLAQQAVATP